MRRQSSKTIPIILTILLIIALCCLGICLVLFVSGAAFISSRNATETPGAIATDPPLVTEPITPSAKDLADDTLVTLQEEIVPINDPIDLADRLGGKGNVPETLPDLNAPYSPGEMKTFWVTNVDTNENFQITTTLRYLGENVYIWIENGVEYEENDLTALGDTFDDKIYPTNREFFGSEWSPGVDNDPRIYIVYAGGLGQSLAGYYSSADQLHPEAHEFSNAHEMFLINSDNVYLWEDYIYGTLAHEFQHMIHWYTDKNEETWLNEGFSMLAELLNDYDPGGFDAVYIRNPDLQLTDWGTEVGENGPHYGAAMLFTTYFLERFGEAATQALVAHDKNGMESIDLVLDELGIRDPITNEIITSEDVFADWAVTNILGDSAVADGRYHYNIYPYAPTATPGNTFTTCPTSPSTFNVAQFGVDYVKIACQGDYTLTFDGSQYVTILPTNPYSGDTFFWSNMGDHSNMSLQQEFDFTEVSGAVEMRYKIWYDLEQDYDYVFVSASMDGEQWQILDTSSCTTENPSGNSYGCGLNGQTDGWQEETIDLRAYAGEEVTIRFDYVTDAAVNGVGLVIDDIQIDAIDYYTDFEADSGGWEAEGFVRIQNALPQLFRVSIISFGEETEVTTLMLDDENRATIEINIGTDIDSIILVISGTTPYTRQKAEYQVEIK